jgi:hypothetical protein
VVIDALSQGPVVVEVEVPREQYQRCEVDPEELPPELSLEVAEIGVVPSPLDKGRRNLFSIGAVEPFDLHGFNVKHKENVEKSRGL